MADRALSRHVPTFPAIHGRMMGTVPSDPSATSGRKAVLVDLALQGGGSHGAFTWGVLDRLLEETWLKIEGVAGT
jgi:NTE family protein